MKGQWSFFVAFDSMSNYNVQYHVQYLHGGARLELGFRGVKRAARLVFVPSTVVSISISISGYPFYYVARVSDVGARLYDKRP